MSHVLAIHGIVGQPRTAGPRTEWLPAILDGLAFGGSPTRAVDLTFVDVGGIRAANDDDADGSAAAARQEGIILHWCRSLGLVERGQALSAFPAGVVPDGLVEELATSQFFGGWEPTEIRAYARQIDQHLHDPDVGATAREHIRAALAADVDVVIAHSVGSASAYRAVNAAADGRRRTLLTIGSPMGLLGTPRGDRRPGPGLARWYNVVDNRDPVPVVKDLRPLYGDTVRDVRCHRYPRARGIREYLATPEFGAALAEALAG
ncbi:MAG: hypothetical protein WCA46_22575 [Actinocatenispora sp.]